jgi:hypothetical protein
MHGKLFCRKSKLIHSQLVNFPTYFRNRCCLTISYQLQKPNNSYPIKSQVSRPLLERSFHRKVQSRKVFSHRESFEAMIAKTEEKLSKYRFDYKQCYAAHRQHPTQQTLTQYIDAHNAYVQQLHATNAMLETYHQETVPQLIQELEEVYADLCSIMSESIFQGAEAEQIDFRPDRFD